MAVSPDSDDPATRGLRLAPSTRNGLAVHRSILFARLFQRRALKRTAAPADAVLSPRALLIWRQRPDLQAAFDLGSTAGRTDLYWWYLLNGYPELGLEADEADPDILRAVSRRLSRLRQLGFTPVTWLMREVYRRSGVRFAPLNTRGGQEQILAWFFAQALMNKRLGDFLAPEQAERLRATGEATPGAPTITALIWQADLKLHDRFAGSDDPAFLAWCRGEGARDFPILAHPLIALAPPWRPPGRVSGRFGVNLIGHAFGRSGLSEDMRAAALSLDAAGIPFAIHDVSPGGAIADEDSTLVGRAATTLPFDINLFCFTAQSTVTAAIANPELGRDRRYSIGMWPWELPEWPAFWHHAYSYVDEIWASSRFTFDAYCRSAPIPVRHLPMAVTVDATEGAVRADFGFPNDRFLFAFAFDGLSTFSRKNPEACIAAFERAFPNRDQPVGLIIKGLRGQGSAAWDRLRGRAEADPRILVVDESLTRGRLLDLYRAIDCFVSLHRSEGFGRNIAEAMLLKKPVIVSAHSGNMDFTGPDTAALVPVRLVTVENSAYPFGDGQMWAEADIPAAARYMRRIASDAEWRRDIARSGKSRVETLYSPHRVGELWAEALRAIGENPRP